MVGSYEYRGKVNRVASDPEQHGAGRIESSMRYKVSHFFVCVIYRLRTSWDGIPVLLL